MLIEENYDIKRLTSFKCGGKIKKVFFPENIDEFVEVLNSNPDVKVFGNLSNTLVSTDGYDGEIVITTKMTNFTVQGNRITADCGLKGPKLAQIAAGVGLSGLEFMVGFPGSIGGEVFMNAGAHGQTVEDCFIEAKCYDKEEGKVVTLSKSSMAFSYRSSICQVLNLIVLSAEFELQKAFKRDIDAKMNENLSFRKSKQPSLALPNCGSVFRNPEGDSAGRLLDAAGVKGLVIGGAGVWENHANFIINERNATSEDILKIIYVMYNEVKEQFGIELQPEVRYLGGNNKTEVEICKKLKMIK